MKKYPLRFTPAHGNRMNNPPFPSIPVCIAWRGFTLVELLVTLAIIGVLAAITIPVVGGVRKKAHEAEAIAKMRGLYLAAMAYSNDNRGAIPAWDMPNSPHVGYCYHLAPYIQTGSGGDYAANMRIAFQQMATKYVPSEYRYYDGNMRPFAPGFPGLAFACNLSFSYNYVTRYPEAPQNRAIRISDVDAPGQALYFTLGWGVFNGSAGQKSMSFPGNPTFLPGQGSQTAPPESERIYFPNGRTTVGVFLDGKVKTLPYPIEKRLIDFWE